ATRGSPLALWQARRVAQRLEASGAETSLVVVETEGDRRTDVPLHSIGGQGVFVKEVQAAVVRGDADLAVHSAKDLPAAAELQVPGLALAAFPERADPRDLLVGSTLDTLATGARVATGSARRRVQLANLRPDLLFTDLRGNLATRLSVAGRGDVAAVVVAAAGVDRLGWMAPDGTETELLDPMVMLPQVGQGALAVECREDDLRVLSALSLIDDASVRRVVTAERAYLAELGGGCTLPVGAHATSAGGDPGTLTLSGMMGSEDGRMVLRHTASGDDPEKLGRSVARYLVDEAGGSSLGIIGDS
ncbi:MAG TPA: hydroxymethylbilane synthase, partial [Acidimicrobiales bacterium]|nr:hydroxymethylbilane synthase [Acidimicrobiales bacterium]